MEKEGPVTDNQIDDEKDLLNFDLDDITSEDSDLKSLESDPEDEIIELMDLVEKGPREEETKDVEVANWLKESQSIEIEKDISTGDVAKAEAIAPAKGAENGEEEFDVSDISLELDLEDVGADEVEGEKGEEDITAAEIEKLLEEKAPQEEIEQEKEEAEVEEKGMAEADLEALLEEATGDEIELELDQEAGEKEGLEEAAMATSDLAEEAAEQELAIEADLEIMRPPEPQPESSIEEESEELEEPVTEGTSAEPALVEEVEAARDESGGAELPGISEERIEAVITRVVEDVVERVVRETVAEVAQKVIAQAIEALEKSLESTSSD